MDSKTRAILALKGPADACDIETILKLLNKHLGYIVGPEVYLDNLQSELFDENHDLELESSPFKLKSGVLRYNDTIVTLTYTELRLFYILASNKGKVVTKIQVRNRLWPGYNWVYVQENYRKYIQRLRKILKTHTSLEHIMTFPGQGYMFIDSNASQS